MVPKKYPSGRLVESPAGVLQHCEISVILFSHHVPLLEGRPVTLPSRRVIAFKVPHVENKGLAETPRAPNFEDEVKQGGRVKVVVGVLYRLSYETKWDGTRVDPLRV